MYSRYNTAAKAYAQQELEGGVATANPHKLVLMLFEGARLSVTTAKLQMELGNVAAKGEAISKAISIIDQGLKASLDVKAGGQLAEKLKGLYEYMSHRLLIANIENRIDILDEVGRLLIELGSAWESIGRSSAPDSAGLPPPSLASQAQRAYGKV